MNNTLGEESELRLELKLSWNDSFHHDIKYSRFLLKDQVLFQFQPGRLKA